MKMRGREKIMIEETRIPGESRYVPGGTENLAGYCRTGLEAAVVRYRFKL